MNVSYHFAALHYLNLWLLKEKALCEGMRSDKAGERLAAIRRGANHFSVARTLPKQYDEQERFQHVLAILDNLSADDVEENVTDAVVRVGSRISEKYGNSSVLSFTSKMLWLKFQSPIIIYDGQVRLALAKKSGDLKDYMDYCEKWRQRYNGARREVESACRSLVRVVAYAADISLTSDAVRAWSEEEWFRQRVFDSYLWHCGSNRN